MHLQMGGWVYMMTNRPFGTLYVGVTNDVARRAWEHREGIGSQFTSKYRLTRLIYMEQHEDIRNAISREKRLKHWPRLWKLNLIEEQNPLWEDLFDRLVG
jgi:putative endonuclease